MILLNPTRLERTYQDERSAEVMRQTVEFFERKGKTRLLTDYYDHSWYADFLDYAKDHRLLATMCTPEVESASDGRWDTWRICEFAEILGFYGLNYWYTWQVSVLGLGPIWMSSNQELRRRAAKALEAGGIFAFGLSEKSHVSDIYSTDRLLTPNAHGAREQANGRPSSIATGNKRAIASPTGRMSGSADSS